MYALGKDKLTNEIVCIKDINNSLWIPFDSANTDYQQFKQAINDGKAELQDADGNVMSAQDTKQFVSTLP